MARIGNLIRDPVELKSRSVQLERLAVMPDRVTKKDLADAAQAMRDCSEDIAYLLSAKNKPIGCPCRQIETDNYSYFEYVDECPHHRQLKQELARMKEVYADAERKLEDKLRVQLLGSALQVAGRADAPAPEVLADRAMAIADAAIARLRK